MKKEIICSGYISHIVLFFLLVAVSWLFTVGQLRSLGKFSKEPHFEMCFELKSRTSTLSENKTLFFILRALGGTFLSFENTQGIKTMKQQTTKKILKTPHKYVLLML